MCVLHRAAGNPLLTQQGHDVRVVQLGQYCNLLSQVSEHEQSLSRSDDIILCLQVATADGCLPCVLCLWVEPLSSGVWGQRSATPTCSAVRNSFTATVCLLYFPL